MRYALKHNGSGFCTRCGIESETEVCTDCEREIATGRVIPDDAPLDTMFALLLRLLPNYSADRLAHELMEYDVALSFQEDSLRGVVTMSESTVTR